MLFTSPVRGFNVMITVFESRKCIRHTSIPIWSVYAGLSCKNFASRNSDTAHTSYLRDADRWRAWWEIEEYDRKTRTSCKPGDGWPVLHLHQQHGLVSHPQRLRAEIIPRVPAQCCTFFLVFKPALICALKYLIHKSKHAGLMTLLIILNICSNTPP